MESKQYEKALADVSAHFDRPEAILGATDLDHAQKVALLEQWDHDLRLLLVASEENMTGNGRGAPPAELLSRVRRALVELGVQQDEQAAAPTKTGGPS
jgi:hypothetical protein